MFKLTELNKEHAADALPVSLVTGQNLFQREDNKEKNLATGISDAKKQRYC